MNALSIIEQCRNHFRLLVSEHGLDDERVLVSCKTLNPQEAIGRPLRRDYPILQGVERVIEARFRNVGGQVFTDAPCDYQGTLKTITELSLSNSRNRAVFLSAMNAVLCHLGIIESTIHCKDEAPEICGSSMADYAFDEGARKVGLIGLNPALAEALVKKFDAQKVFITDLNPDNINVTKFGVIVRDGKTGTDALVKSSDIIFVTGTSLVNGTFDDIRNKVLKEGKRLIIYGISGAGICKLMKLERFCPESMSGRN